MTHAPKLMRAIDKAWQRHEAPRGYLGASSLGGPCSRQLWYGFRWATKKAFPPRVLRLFDRGNREEEVFENLLREAGVTFYSRDPATNTQFVVKFPNPHIGGHCDGVGEGLPDLPPGTAFTGEWKTHNHKSFSELVRKGVRDSKPQHFVQMQLYMHRLELKWALYGAVNKNDDHLYWELVPYEENIATAFETRGNVIAYTLAPPDRINENPGWYQCKFCDHHAV